MIPVVIDTGVFVAQPIIARDADLTVLEKPFGIQVLTPRAWLAGLSRADRRRLD